MVQPNYNFAKRQRELAKKAKKEQKLQRKAAAPEADANDASPNPEESVPPTPTEQQSP